MSELKHLNLKQLNDAEDECERQINYHKSRINGQQSRLEWIHHYQAIARSKPKPGVFRDWLGGEPPVGPMEPVTVRWPNGITRTYENGNHVVWRNLKTDGSVKWCLPEIPV